MHGNLFVVSRLGQLRNVQTFIREFDATGNRLAVLFTDANRGLYSAIMSYVSADLFEEIVGIEQPRQPLSQSRAKNRTIYQQIEGLVVGAAESGVTSLFLCNADAYYSLFERVIRKRALQMSVNLLEEGLTTYAIAGAKRYERDTSVDWSDVRHRARIAGRASARALKAIAILLGSVVSWVVRVDLFDVYRRLTVRLFIDEVHRYGAITEFDTAYVYFPDRVHRANVDIEHVQRLPFTVEPNVSPTLLGLIEEDAVVFVSQKYLGAEQYFNIVFDILGEMGLERVHFKFHPREDRSAFARVRDELAARHPHLSVVYPEEIQAIPVEELLMSGRVRQMIGLTSTSLMYASAFFPGVDVVSIGTRFRDVALSDEYAVAKRPLAEFVRDLEVFLDVSDVRQF